MTPNDFYSTAKFIRHNGDNNAEFELDGKLYEEVWIGLFMREVRSGGEVIFCF